MAPEVETRFKGLDPGKGEAVFIVEYFIAKEAFQYCQVTLIGQFQYYRSQDKRQRNYKVVSNACICDLTVT
jgi:hypothetical protein